MDLKSLIQAEGRTTPIIAKIEKPEALDAIDEILDAADGIMVARGDLGVEWPPEAVPIVQQELVTPGAAQEQAGDRGDADARVDDRQPPADAGRGVRRVARPSSAAPTR